MYFNILLKFNNNNKRPCLKMATVDKAFSRGDWSKIDFDHFT